MFLLTFQSMAQEITIIDKLTQQAIPSAKVESRNPKIQRLADVNGRFQLEDFVGCDTIIISYPNYEESKFTYNELQKVVWVELSYKLLDVSGAVVTANRWEQDKGEIPVRITKLDIKGIEMQGPQTSADLLESSGDVYVQKSQLAGGSPQLRGFGTNRVMIVVDGVRMNNAIFRSGNLQNVISLDVNSLEDVEVLFGPGAVMYGSDAIGGVMDFTTKKALFSPDSLNKLVRTNVYSRYSTSSNELTGHVDFNFGKRNWAMLSSVSYSKYGDMRAGIFGDSSFLRPTFQENGITVINSDPRLQVHSGFDQLNILQKFQFQPSDELEWEYTFNFSNNLSNPPRYDRLTQDSNNDGALDYEEWYYGPQKWMMHRFGVKHSRKTKFYDQFRVVGAYQNFEESRHDRRTGAPSIRRQFEEVHAASINIDFDKEQSNKTTLFYGMEGVFNLVKSNAYREADTGTITVINPRYPDGATWQSYGVYGSVKHSLNKDWIMSAGIRGSGYFISAEFDTTLFAYPETSTRHENLSLSGSFGIVYHPNNNTQYYFNVGTGFRAPNIDDIGKVFDSEPGSVVVPNPNLKAEHAFNGEIGWMKAWSGKLKFDGALYYTYLKDALARSNFSYQGQDSMIYEGVQSNIVAIQNVSDAHVYGAQAGLEWIISKGWSLYSRISYQKGTEYNVDSASYFPKLHVAPLFGRTGIRYSQRQLKLELYSVYNGELSHEELPLSERDDLVYATDANGNTYSPSWYTLNFKAAYFFNKHLSMNAGIENITNQLYRTVGSGISASGLNVMVSVKATF